MKRVHVSETHDNLIPPFVQIQEFDLQPPPPVPKKQHYNPNHPLSTKNPRNKGFSGSGAPIFGFGLADPAPKG